MEFTRAIQMLFYKIPDILLFIKYHVLFLLSKDGGHPQREGGPAGDWHPHHQQEHIPHTQDHRPSQSREACALHPQAHRLQHAGRHGPRSQGGHFVLLPFIYSVGLHCVDASRLPMERS